MSAHGKILIADDEPAIRKVLALYCSQAGYETMTVEDGLEALELAFWNSFDLIITDYHMPRMNGLDFCRHVRLYDRHVHTPVLMCSSAIAELDTDSILNEIGRITFLPKPLDLPGIQALLAKGVF